MSNELKAELGIGPSSIDAYSRLSYTMWFALAEFVDNSTQSRLNYESVIDEVLTAEGRPLTVTIFHDRVERTMTIEDNSIGMTRADLVAALQIAVPTPDSRGRSKYGMGLKTAACWIGERWSVTTCEWSSGKEWTATVDVKKVVAGDTDIPLSVRDVGKDQHYTKVRIEGMRRKIQNRTEETIRLYLGSMYMFDLREDKGKVALKLIYNDEEITPPSEYIWDTDPAGTEMKRDLPTLTLGSKTVEGWIGVLRTGGRKYGGFSMFQNGRQIQGHPNGWKPRTIFGGVDDEGANNLVAQRLTGVLLLDGFVVSHTKDAILFEGDEEDDLEKFLVKETKEYAKYAKERRTKGKGPKWSKDKVRELTMSLHKEFESGEMRDAISRSMLPPLDTIVANNVQVVRTLTPDDELQRFEIFSDLIVIVSMKEVSEWEPYVIFAPGAEKGILHVIINGLHPYYQTLETNDVMEECIHQYVLDAVAEYKVEQMAARVNPDSVRRLKNELLRARVDRIDNADEAVRAQARDDLFSGTDPQG